MVFPSLLFKVEPGIISQSSAILILIFSFLIHRIKKFVVISLLLIGGILCAYSSAHAIAMMPSYNYNNFPNQNFMSFYGRPWGFAPPVYFYPGMYSYPMMPMQQYYFNPHPMSPYNPYFNCPTCNQPQPNTFPIIHPGGGVS